MCYTLPGYVPASAFTWGRIQPGAVLALTVLGDSFAAQSGRSRSASIAGFPRLRSEVRRLLPDWWRTG